MEIQPSSTKHSSANRYLYPFEYSRLSEVVQTEEPVEYIYQNLVVAILRENPDPRIPCAEHQVLLRFEVRSLLPEILDTVGFLYLGHECFKEFAYGFTRGTPGVSVNAWVRVIALRGSFDWFPNTIPKHPSQTVHLFDLWTKESGERTYHTERKHIENAFVENGVPRWLVYD